MTGDCVIKEQWRVGFKNGSRTMNTCQVCELQKEIYFRQTLDEDFCLVTASSEAWAFKERRMRANALRYN